MNPLLLAVVFAQQTETAVASTRNMPTLQFVLAALLTMLILMVVCTPTRKR